MGLILFPSTLLDDCRLICDWIISIHRNIRKEAKGVIISNFYKNWLLIITVWACFNSKWTFCIYNMRPHWKRQQKHVIKKIKYQIFRQVTFVCIQCDYGQICCNQPASSLSHYTVIQFLPLLLGSNQVDATWLDD